MEKASALFAAHSSTKVPLIPALCQYFSISCYNRLTTMPTKTDNYKKTFTEDDAPGLDAINNREKEIYGAREPTT